MAAAGRCERVSGELGESDWGSCMRNSIRVVTLALLGVLVTSVCAPAQVFTGTIFGSVHDPAGAPAVGTSITLTNSDTAYRRVEKSDDAGNYLFGAMPPGNYEILAESAGFKQE